MKTSKLIIFTSLFGLLFLGQAVAQNSERVKKQQQVIANLEKKIASEEKRIQDLRSDRKATEKRMRLMARQIENRTQLLAETEQEATILKDEIRQKDSLAGDLASTLERYRKEYKEMVREAYRNYRHNNYLTYIFSSKDFEQVARKITNLRAVASMRQQKLEKIDELSKQVKVEQEALLKKKASLDEVMKKLNTQRENLKRDTRNAQLSIRKMSASEKSALQRKLSQEQELDSAISELRKLTKGNKQGSSFSTHTSGLHLPVVGGRVKLYKGNMAEIAGAKGAKVISIYDGKVIDIRRDRITAKYIVYIAHGEYLTTYGNLASVCVEKGANVVKNAQIGTVGASVNIMTMESDYKIIFGVYPPNPKTHMKAADCFKK